MTGDKIRITLADNIFTIYDLELASLCSRLPGVLRVERYDDLSSAAKIAKLTVRNGDVVVIRKILEDAGHEIEVAK